MVEWKNIAAAMSVILFLLAAGTVLKEIWQQSGIAENPKQKQFAASSLRWEKPALETKDKRFSGGGDIIVSELASARDFDGTDLTSEIRYYNEEGRQIARRWRAEVPGIYRVEAVVESPVTKRENRKSFLVLIDGGESG